MPRPAVVVHLQRRAHAAPDRIVTTPKRPKLTTLKTSLQALPRLVGTSSGATSGSWSTSRETSARRGYGYAWQQLRLRILERDHGLCQPCRTVGRLTPGRDVDHKINRAQGGTDDEDNLQVTCPACHKAKTAAESRGLPWAGPDADRAP